MAKTKKAKTKRKATATNRGSCFVLMPFKEPFDTYFDTIIEPAVTTAHLRPLRGDSLFRPSPIMGDIWQMIQDAKVLVAELTEKNANVFYELGLAHALGKPVILVSETIDDVPFDLQPLRVILYNKSNPAWGAKLKGDLVDSLAETMQDVTKAVPPMFRKVVKSHAPEDSDVSIRLAQLERVVAAMSPANQPSAGVGDRRIDWERVDKYLKTDRGRKDPSEVPGFQAREHAVAWAIRRLRSLGPSEVRERLSTALSPTEAEVVVHFALSAPSSIRRRS